MTGTAREMTVPERLDQTMTELHVRIEDVKARNLREVSWARRQALQEAYAAVASLNGNGVTEPADDALDAAQSAIQRLLDSNR